MKCSEVQEAILTDFSDHEAAPELRENITRHLAVCEDCRELELLVRTRLMQPFDDVVIKAPADIWDGIQERIHRLPEPGKWYNVFPIEFSLPKFALAAALVLMLAGVAKIGYQKRTVWQKDAAIYVMENMNYMESLSNNEETSENVEIEELI